MRQVYLFILPILANAYQEQRFPLHSPGSDNDVIVKHDVPWDYFMLVMEWPQSICEYVNKTHLHHVCVIPPLVKGWTLHGLWPSSDDGDYPTKCTNETFKEDQIYDLEPELNQHWPNLYKGSGKCSLWSHEYEKHGTCAGQVTKFFGEHAYFAETVKLKQKYDIMRVLQDDGIVPRAKPYELSDIQVSIGDYFQVDTCIECSSVHEDGKKVQLLSGFYACLSKDDQLLIDCDETCEHPCMDEPIFYRPIQN